MSRRKAGASSGSKVRNERTIRSKRTVVDENDVAATKNEVRKLEKDVERYVDERRDSISERRTPHTTPIPSLISLERTPGTSASEASERVYDSPGYLFGQLSRNRPVLRRIHFPQRICRKISARA